jgi:methionine--tRNA ligase beta chain
MLRALHRVTALGTSSRHLCVAPFARLDVRVGRIVEAWPHPQSTKLWCEKVDVGEPAHREIASGLRAYYSSAQDLEGRAVAVVCNLKPAKLGGFLSSGMLLCASSEDGAQVEFVEPPRDAEPGETILCEGMDAEPASPSQVKRKKIFEACSEDLRAVERVATYRGVPLRTRTGSCTVATIPYGPIR